MNAVSLSLRHETSSVFAQRTLKLALVLGLHAGVAGLMMLWSQNHTPEFIRARVAIRPVEVSFIQAQAVAVKPVTPQQPTRVAKPHVEPAKQPPKVAQHPAPPAKPTAPPPMLAATPSVAPSATPSAAPVMQAKEEAAPAPAAPQPTPLIAAHVDANYAQKTSPPYPAISRRLHEEGKVQLLVDVSPKGEVASIFVKQSSGFPRLDDVALNTVRSWHFVPARRGDVAVADSVVVPVLFKLND